MKHFEWTEECCSDLSGCWLQCDVDNDMSLTVEYSNTEMSYKPWLTYGPDCDDCIYGPPVYDIDEAKDIAVEMFYAFCMQRAEEFSEMAIGIER